MSIPIEMNSDTCMYWCGCLVKDMGKVYKLYDVEENPEYDPEDDIEYSIYIPIGIDEEGNINTLIDPEPYIPKLGYRQLDKIAVYYSREKRRQYKKGLHMDYIRIFCPQEKEVEAVGEVHLLEKTFDIFNLIEQEYPTLEEAIDSIASRDKWSVAIHNWWAIVLKVGYDNPLLYYKRAPVGEVVNNSIKFFEGQSERKFSIEVKHV